jgi:predicted flap endonuclease-1-like 5' DNA nuclease
VAWFLGQSLLIIFASILLGLLVGWLLWGRSATRPGKAAERAEGATEPMPVEPPSPVPAQPQPETLAPEPETLAAEPETLAAEQVAAAETQETQTQETQETQTQDAGTQLDDDLERIEGIGPKMAAALRQAKIRTFAQLASSDEVELRKAIEDAGLRFAPSLATWARQARLLADRDEEGFADLVRRLVAGRDVGRS